MSELSGIVCMLLWVNLTLRHMSALCSRFSHSNVSSKLIVFRHFFFQGFHSDVRLMYYFGVLFANVSAVISRHSLHIDGIVQWESQLSWCVDQHLGGKKPFLGKVHYVDGCRKECIIFLQRCRNYKKLLVVPTDSPYSWRNKWPIFRFLPFGVHILKNPPIRMYRFYAVP